MGKISEKLCVAPGVLTGDLQRIGWLMVRSHVWKMLLAKKFLKEGGSIWSCRLTGLAEQVSPMFLPSKPDLLWKLLWLFDFNNCSVLVSVQLGVRIV